MHLWLVLLLAQLPTERAVAHVILVAQLTMGCYFALLIIAAGPHVSAVLRLQVGQVQRYIPVNDQCCNPLRPACPSDCVHLMLEKLFYEDIC